MDPLDYFAIQNLVYTYAAKIDAGDYDGVGAMFEHADVWFPGDTEPTSKKGKNIMGRMLHEWTRKYPETGNPRTRHVTTNLIIEPDGPNKARGQCYVVVLQQTPAFKLQPVIAGTYVDRFEKVDGKWRFSERREVMDLIGDLSHHLLQPFGPG
jgi:3-phenylpropionate/cinnamic acid dioxygenase small subunit